MDHHGPLSRYFAQVESPVRVVGVPKTIGNDLEGTDPPRLWQRGAIRCGRDR